MIRPKFLATIIVLLITLLFSPISGIADSGLPPGVEPDLEEESGLPPGVLTNNPPVITQFNVFPLSPEPGAPLDITVRATDDVAVKELILTYMLIDSNDPPFARNDKFCPGDSNTSSDQCRYHVTFDGNPTSVYHRFSSTSAPYGIWAPTSRLTKFSFSVIAIDSEGLTSTLDSEGLTAVPSSIEGTTTEDEDEDDVDVFPSVSPPTPTITEPEPTPIEPEEPTPTNNLPVITQFDLPSTADKDSDITATVTATDSDGGVDRIEILNEDSTTILATESCGNIASCTKSFTLRVIDAFNTVYTFIAHVFDSDSASVTQTKSGTTNPAPTPTEPEPEEPDVSAKKQSKLFVSSLRLVDECVAPGQETYLFASIKNKGDKQLKDVKVTSTIQDLGVRAASGPFTIKKRSSASRLLFLDIPSDTEEDVYYLRTAVTSRKESNAKYRILEVNKVC